MRDSTIDSPCDDAIMKLGFIEYGTLVLTAYEDLSTTKSRGASIREECVVALRLRLATHYIGGPHLDHTVISLLLPRLPAVMMSSARPHSRFASSNGFASGSRESAPLVTRSNRLR